MVSGWSVLSLAVILIFSNAKTACPQRVSIAVANFYDPLHGLFSCAVRRLADEICLESCAWPMWRVQCPAQAKQSLSPHQLLVCGSVIFIFDVWLFSFAGPCD